MAQNGERHGEEIVDDGDAEILPHERARLRGNVERLRNGCQCVAEKDGIGLRLGELLVDLGRVENGENLAAVDMIADIGEPAPDIAVGPSIDGGAVIGLDVAGQH